MLLMEKEQVMKPIRCGFCELSGKTGGATRSRIVACPHSDVIRQTFLNDILTEYVKIPYAVL